MSIGEVARCVGLRPSALRYYEAEGLIEPTARVSGRRRYDGAVLDRLAIIALAQSVGFTIAEIRELLAGLDADRLSDHWRAMARTKLAKLERDIARARSMTAMLERALDCGCADLASCALALEAS